MNDQISTPQCAQQRAGEGAGRDPRRRLPGRGALEHVPDVGDVVLEGPRKVGVTGSDTGDRHRPLVAAVGERGELCRRLVRQGLDRHDLGPVLPVAVRDREQDRRPERPTVPDTRDDLGPVVLDRLAGAATVAALPAPEVDSDLVGRHREAGRQPLDDDREASAVRFAGRQEAEPAHDPARSGER